MNLGRRGRKMEDDGIEANTYVQLIQFVWAESRALTLNWNIVHWREYRLDICLIF